MQLISFLRNIALSDYPREADLVLSLAKKEYYVVDGIFYYEGTDLTN